MSGFLGIAIGIVFALFVLAVFVSVIWSTVWFIWHWTNEFFCGHTIFLVLARTVIYGIGFIFMLKFWMFWTFSMIVAYMIPYMLFGGH